jgi:capsular polysaccharide biosynthesis protein
MKMKEFFAVFFGNWRKIVIVTIITTIAATAFGLLYDGNPVSATIFVNIGAVQDMTFSEAKDPFNTLQAADQFTESVQGWFKNPSFLEEIKSGSGLNVDFNVRKQEKQNLLLTFRSDTPENAMLIATVTRTGLEKRISSYNSMNASNFTLSLFDTFLNEGTTPIWLFPLAGLVCGLFIGYFLALLWKITVSEYNLYRHGK